ncbi:uncharacterized protein CTRU02_211227 [Colletotrichum truncatum]|uniref:Uncharacterized protein n=2 Tax=Colletotrichum truncatum TaxID=5467 RepID=A0ACC3YR69_COLTU|nr:uncharacterized protein CTRU02_08412 [Colletotrichum truncatum]XP_036587994.1 uncharacterized protein CTRU02_02006 [Colletotrichum truncatum]KAF6790283.1 hypothetical protein CTRU02_08412 [Colletotrichum truncatum]KAF6799135.1 hypothetical protein CTRU02_02006 [Colletotrichum truncatum]
MNFQYSAIKNVKTRDHEKSFFSCQDGRWKTVTWAVLLGLALMASLTAILNIFKYPTYDYDTKDQRTKRCGTTATEAKARGCHFDPVSFAWLPEECLDLDLAEEFRALNWTLYADIHGTKIKSEEEFSSDTTDTFLTNENHVLHCVYSWKRLHRSIQARKPLHSGLSYDHTKHCGGVLTSQRPPKQIVTKALVIYPAC